MIRGDGTPSEACRKGSGFNESGLPPTREPLGFFQTSLGEIPDQSEISTSPL